MIADYLAGVTGLPPFPIVMLLLGLTLLLLGLLVRGLDHATRPAGYTPTLRPAPERDQRLPPVIGMPTHRGVCRWCGSRQVRLLPDGRLSRHAADLTGSECDGSFTEPTSLVSVQP